MTDIVERLRRQWEIDDYDMSHLLREAAAEIARLRADNERLRALLKHADDTAIWEHTVARSGFQEESACGRGHGE